MDPDSGGPPPPQHGDPGLGAAEPSAPPQGLRGFLERMKGLAPWENGEGPQEASERPDGATERGDPAGIEDIRIRRDADGRVVPLVVELPRTEIQVKMVPFSYGFWRSVLDEAGSFRELTLDQKAAMIQECVVPADAPWEKEYPGGLTPEILQRDFDAQTVDDLTWACWEYSNARRREGYQTPGKASASGTATSSGSTARRA